MFLTRNHQHILVAGLRIISPRLRHSEQVSSIVSGLLFSFRENLLKDLIDRASGMPVLIFNICSAYEIVAYDWLYSKY